MIMASIVVLHLDKVSNASSSSSSDSIMSRKPEVVHETSSTSIQSLKGKNVDEVIECSLQRVCRCLKYPNFQKCALVIVLMVGLILLCNP